MSRFLNESPADAQSIGTSWVWKYDTASPTVARLSRQNRSRWLTHRPVRRSSLVPDCAPGKPEHVAAEPFRVHAVRDPRSCPLTPRLPGFAVEFREFLAASRSRLIPLGKSQRFDRRSSAQSRLRPTRTHVPSRD